MTGADALRAGEFVVSRAGVVGITTTDVRTGVGNVGVMWAGEVYAVREWLENVAPLASPEGARRLGAMPWHADGRPCVVAVVTGQCPEGHRYGDTFADAI